MIKSYHLISEIKIFFFLFINMLKFMLDLMPIDILVTQHSDEENKGCHPCNEKHF